MTAVSSAPPLGWRYRARVSTSDDGVLARGRSEPLRDAWLVQQGWREHAYVSGEVVLELGGLGGRGLDAAGEAAQDEPGRELVGARGA